MVFITVAACKVPALVPAPAKSEIPATYNNNSDTSHSAVIPWRQFFRDSCLTRLIDTALAHNQELAITLQDIVIAQNDILVKRGKLKPEIRAGGAAGIDKVGRYTSQGAGDASTEIKAGKPVPEWLPDWRLGAMATWEADIWKKLRNDKEAATQRYFATVEGKNFVITSLVAELASAYYELLSLDNQLAIVRQTIGLQQDALEIMKVQKTAARVTELAVKKFEAEVLNTQSLEYDILQQIREKENEINFLAGRYPQPVERSRDGFLEMPLPLLHSGVPSQLLSNRPDIRKAEWELSAAQLDVKVARAEFYPSFELSAALGLNAFKPAYLVKLPESILFSLAGDLAGPLINKNAIRAEFSNANARQLQALYNYEKTILNACIEVSSGLSAISNLEKAYQLKSNETETLIRSVAIANDLFKSARADYFEVLMTQRDALSAKLELVANKMEQWKAVTGLYRSLGGGWQ